MNSSAPSQTKIDGLRKLKGDFRLHAKTCAKVKGKDGKLASLVLNEAQEYVHAKLDEQRAKTGKVRALVLKGRQQGISTYISWRFYRRATLNRGVSVFILTHEQPATDNLFNMAKRYNDNNPIAPSTKNDSAKELVFGVLDSGYAVATAGSKAVGRSKTITLLHGSEAAFWPNAQTHFAGVVQAVPDLPGTEIILESTANGVGGEFHERWQQAERGIGDYIAIFVPWFWSSEYRRAVPEGFALDEEEQVYKATHGLDDGQMVWRRAKITELKDPLLFKQEYPATAAEAFQMTGHDGFIKAPAVLAARKAELEGYGPLVIGADPARFGDDLFAVAWRQGRKVRKVDSKPKCDVVEGATWLKNIIDEDRPARVFIDVGGVGGGTYDMLVAWGYSRIVVPVNFGSAPYFKPEPMKDGSPAPYYANRRAEIWGLSRDWLSATGGADIPDMDALQTDACGPKYKYDADQDIVLESKEAMRLRGVSSPDYWDAVALTFAEPVREVQAVAKPSRPRSGWMGR